MEGRRRGGGGAAEGRWRGAHLEEEYGSAGRRHAVEPSRRHRHGPAARDGGGLDGDAEPVLRRAELVVEELLRRGALVAGLVHVEGRLAVGVCERYTINCDRQCERDRPDVAVTPHSVDTI